MGLTCNKLASEGSSYCRFIIPVQWTFLLLSTEAFKILSTEVFFIYPTRFYLQKYSYLPFKEAALDIFFLG